MSQTASVDLEKLKELHPADLADRLQRMPDDDSIDVITHLAPPLAARALGEMEDEKAVELLALLSNQQVAALLVELPHEDAADLAAALPAVKRRDVLTALPHDAAAGIRALLRYPDDTAGGIMSDRFIALPADITVQQAHEILRSRRDEPLDDVTYLYVTDGQNRLVGIVSLRDLVFRRPERRIDEIMNRVVTSVRAEADQEELARQFEHYHYLGLPVLDADGRLAGVVKASEILQVAKEEATEDMQLMVGLSGEERALTPWHKSIRRRLPWLYVNLATAFAAAAVVSLFEGTIAKWTALAIFLPIVAGQGGNAGMQTLTIIIRDLALGELSAGDGRKALFKETVLAVVNGLAIGLVVGVIGFLWKGSATLGVVAGAAMLLNQIAAAMSGVLIPLGLKTFKVDPALASSIFLTTVTDVAGFFFFLGLAALALRWFGM
jgi:magnesium transporter